MKAGKFSYVAAAIAVVSFFLITYQNCAKSKFNDPDTRHSAIALGLCRICEDDAGSGLSCRPDKNSSYTRCFYESCNPGFLHNSTEFTCTPVECEAGQHANCVVDHGHGTMTCASNSQGYGACHAIQCDEGYTLSEAHTCVAIEQDPPTTGSTTGSETGSTTGSDTGSTTGSETGGTTGSDTGSTSGSDTGSTTGSTGTPNVCVPGEPRNCSTDSQYGVETCNNDGSGFGECVMGDCKPGYYLGTNGDVGGGEIVSSRPKVAAPMICLPQVCEPTSITPCTAGVGSGYKTCNSNGSGFGVCVLEGCQSGYTLKDGVCVVQTCTPGSKTTCDFDHGNGEKTCNADGLDWGACQFIGCHNNYYKDTDDEDGDGNTNECKHNKCTPSSQDTCTGENGTGVMYCYENGKGHGPCQLNACGQGFKLKHGQCVSENSCEDGETFECIGTNGTGLIYCKPDHTKGTCVLTACNSGYTLEQNGNSAPQCKQNKK